MGNKDLKFKWDLIETYFFYQTGYKTARLEGANYFSGLIFIFSAVALHLS